MATRTTTILLLRHPEKDPATGNLKGSGKNTLHDFLTTLWRIGGFDSLKLLVSPLPRGQQSISVLERFTRTIVITCTVSTSPLLQGLADRIDGEAMIAELNQQLGTAVTAVTDGRPKYEPPSADFEKQGNHLLIKEYYDQEFPGCPFTRREHGAQIGEMVRTVAREEPIGEKTLVVAISHSGVVEDWLKTVYLENHPNITDATKVGAKELGGLLGFCEGPMITITYDSDGEASAILDRRHLRGLKVSLD